MYIMAALLLSSSSEFLLVGDEDDEEEEEEEEADDVTKGDWMEAKILLALKRMSIWNFHSW